MVPFCLQDYRLQSWAGTCYSSSNHFPGLVVWLWVNCASLCLTFLICGMRTMCQGCCKGTVTIHVKSLYWVQNIYSMEIKYHCYINSGDGQNINIQRKWLKLFTALTHKTTILIVLDAWESLKVFHKIHEVQMTLIIVWKYLWPCTQCWELPCWCTRKGVEQLLVSQHKEGSSGQWP